MPSRSRFLPFATVPVLAAVVVLGFAQAAPGQPAAGGRLTFASGAGPGPSGGSWSESISTAAADGSGRVRLTTRRDTGQPAWSPDRTRIAFVGDLDTETQYDLYTMNADGSDVTRLTDSYEHEGHPSWSPDGTRLVFSRGRMDVYRIVVASSAGGGEKEIAIDGFAPSWSPDGSRIVYSTWNANRLMVTAPDGTNRRRLIASSGLAYEHAPSWSPDGKQIVFTGGPTDVEQVHVVRADGTGLKRLTPTSVETASPVFTADGTRILYVERHTVVASIKPDGADRKTLFQGTEWLTHIAVAGGAVPAATTTTAPNQARPAASHPPGVRCTIDGSKTGRWYDSSRPPSAQGTSTNKMWTITGTSQNDVICGTSARDRLSGGGGDDVIYGGPGNDNLSGGPGNDKLYGGDGRDILRDGEGSDLLDGGPDGDDLGAVDFQIPEAMGRDRLVGGPGDDILSSFDHNRDDVDGGAGVDRSTADPAALDSLTAVEVVCRKLGAC